MSKFFLNKEMNNFKNENNNDFKTINTIIKDLSISPQKKLYIYINSKPHEMINDGPKALKGPQGAEKNNFKYYLYDIKDMFLAPNNNTQKDNIKKINKEYTPQQIRLNKELKNIFTDKFNTIQLIYDTTPKTF